MALECYCFRGYSHYLKHSQSWAFIKARKEYYVANKVNVHLRSIAPKIHSMWPSKILNHHYREARPLLACFQSHIYFNVGLKYQSNNKCHAAKSHRPQEIQRPVNRHDVIKGVKMAIEEKKQKLHLAEERWKNNSKHLLADIKETRSKMKEKMEEIIERENIWTVPNLLCVSRIALSPVLGYFIYDQNFNMALGVLILAGVTDVLDGWIARTFKNQSSKLGSFLDPMADKILIATMFLTLTYAGIIPVYLTGLIISRDVILVTAGFIIRYKSLPPPRTLSRYFDVSHATAQLAPTLISKVNTTVQLLTVACTLAAPVFGYVDHPALHALWYLTAGTTVASAGSYLLSKNTYRFLKKS